jgi:hypothetical protein
VVGFPVKKTLYDELWLHKVLASLGQLPIRTITTVLIWTVTLSVVSANESPLGYALPGDLVYGHPNIQRNQPNDWPIHQISPGGGLPVQPSWFANVDSIGAVRPVQFTNDSDPAFVPQEAFDSSPPVLDEMEVLNHPSFSCPGGCPSSWYFRAEALYLDRKSQRSSLSNDFSLGAFDHDLGSRITLGRRLDCLEAWELTYVGPFKYTTQGNATGVSLNTSLVASGVNLSAFNGAVFHHQVRNSQLNSFEVMKKYWGWDILATSIGIRYLNVANDFHFTSIDPAPGSEVGLLNLDLDNHIVGPQIGLDLLYPHNRWTFGSRLKGGVYGNYAQGRLQVLNAGVVQVDNDVNRGQFSLLGEFGVSASYQVTPRVSLRVGYEAWLLYGVANTTDQILSPLSPTTLRIMESGGDTFFHGGSVGVETTW